MKSKYFKREEFACKCGCGFDTVDTDTLEVLEDLRAFFEKPVIITSGCRCHKHNQSISGQLRSQHVYGRAADVVVKDIAPITVYSYLDGKYKDQYGLGKYDTFTHVDTRSNKARW